MASAKYFLKTQMKLGNMDVTDYKAQSKAQASLLINA